VISNGAPTFRIFKTRPGQDLINKFMAHIRETGQPETFPGLYCATIAKTEPFLILKRFDIDRKKRPARDKAACPMCQPNKYLSGTLIYIPRLLAIAAIGHCCADKDNLAASSREYRERTERDEQETYLLAHVPLVPACLSVIEKARPAAREARRVYRHFRTRGAEFQRELRLVKMNSGRLTVSEQIEGETAAFGPAGFRSPTTNVNIREVEFGTLRGMIALNTQYDPVGELDRIQSRLRTHNHAETEDAYLEYIAEMTPLPRRAATVQLREAANHYSKFQARIADFCAFFTPENLRRIHDWASHPARAQRFEVSLTGTRCTFRSRSTSCSMVLDPVLWAYHHPWPKPQG
jgi:hypothetical protein